MFDFGIDTNESPINCRRGQISQAGRYHRIIVSMRRVELSVIHVFALRTFICIYDYRYSSIINDLLTVCSVNGGRTCTSNCIYLISFSKVYNIGIPVFQWRLIKEIDILRLWVQLWNLPKCVISLLNMLIRTTGLGFGNRYATKYLIFIWWMYISNSTNRPRTIFLGFKWAHIKYPGVPFY